jgi:adenosylcobinamide-GDP ribazoletransferase
MSWAPSSRIEFAAWRGEALHAASFLTRLPVGGHLAAGDGTLARAGWAFPLVGVVVGVAGWIAYDIAGMLGLPGLVAALVAVAATAFLTGALHEDGLADTLDGLGGGTTREAKLAIMRDSRNGSFGTLALVLSVGLRAAALASIADGQVLGALVAAHALARGALPVAMHRLDPARSDGLGAGAGRPSGGVAVVSAALGIVVALLGLGLGLGMTAVLIAGAAMLLIALLARRALGGYTGDVLGAIEQTGEIIMLMAASTWLS